jgi:hypothetical protein
MRCQKTYPAQTGDWHGLAGYQRSRGGRRRSLLMAVRTSLAIHEEAPCIWQKANWMARNGLQQNLQGFFRKSREQPARNWHAFLVTDGPCSERDSSVSRRSQPDTGRTADWFRGRGAPLDSLQKQDEVLSVPYAWFRRLITTLRRPFRALTACHGHHNEFEPGLEQPLFAQINSASLLGGATSSGAAKRVVPDFGPYRQRIRPPQGAALAVCHCPCG